MICSCPHPEHPGRLPAKALTKCPQRAEPVVSRSRILMKACRSSPQAFLMLSVVVLSLTLAGGARAGNRGVMRYLDKPADWFAGPEARDVARNILSYQSDLGGWPKNVDTTAA